MTAQDKIREALQILYRGADRGRGQKPTAAELNEVLCLLEDAASGAGGLRERLIIIAFEQWMQVVTSKPLGEYPAGRLAKEIVDTANAVFDRASR